MPLNETVALATPRQTPWQVNECCHHEARGK